MRRAPAEIVVATQFVSLVITAAPGPYQTCTSEQLTRELVTTAILTRASGWAHATSGQPSHTAGPKNARDQATRPYITTRDGQHQRS